MRPKVTIVILNWNKLSEMLECLRSVYMQKYANYDVVVVDNGSNDGSLDIIKKEFAKTCIIKNSFNLGFAGGNNVGLKYAVDNGTDYIWLLNNDTVVEKDTLSQLVIVGESDEKIGLLSPIIYYYGKPEVPQFRGSIIDWNKLTIMYPDESDSNVDIAYHSGERVCLWGTALLIKRKVVEEIGYLDENYFAYWEDTEYSLRSIKKGFRNRVCSFAKVWHKVDPDDYNSSNRSKYYYYFMNRNRILLIKEYAVSSLQKIRSYRMWLASLIRDIGCCARDRAKENLDACLLGAWHGIKGTYGPMHDKATMPTLYRNLFVTLANWHPFFLASIIEYDSKEIKRAILNRLY